MFNVVYDVEDVAFAAKTSISRRNADGRILTLRLALAIAVAQSVPPATTHAAHSCVARAARKAARKRASAPAQQKHRC